MMREGAFTLGIAILLLAACNEVVVRNVDGIQVPEGFTIERAVLSPELHAYPMFATFNDQGDLYVCESTLSNTMETDAMLAHPSYQIRLLSDTDGDDVFDRSTIFADSLPFPMGGVFHQGSFYSAVSPNLLKFTDIDGDGVADEREVILSGWTLNSNGAILSGPFLSPDGYFYLADARRGFDITDKEGQRHVGRGARIWRCLPDGSELKWISGGGFDNSIEIIFTEEGETIGTMTYFTDPKDGERDALMHWIEGGVYPKPNPTIAADKLPRTGPLMPVMTKMPRVAPAGLMQYRSLEWGANYNGNLFTAEFNTGRIMRYRMQRQGSSFSTTGETFMEAMVPDVHPTDVLQAADGSMLVIITGGWFIKGCPLSRVAKPEVQGGIYRIRKVGSKAIADPWGREISFDKSSLDELGKYITDGRFRVRKKAIQELIDRGLATEIMNSALEETPDPELRCELVFAFAQMEGQMGLELVREALGDDDHRVRIAAARCLGSKRDIGSRLALEGLLMDEHPAVRRQAATALGQITSEQSIASLLSALAHPQERLVEHAIIYALIQTQVSAPLQMALSSASPAVRKGALIALDQMKDAALGEDQLIPFLTSADSSDQVVAAWIASGHPTWSKSVGAFLRERLKDVKRSNQERQTLQQLMGAFSGDEGIQGIIVDQLSASTTSLEEKRFLLEIMRTTRLDEFPALWVTVLEDLLAEEGEVLKDAILEVVETRGIGMSDGLISIIEDEHVAPNLRIKALGVRLRHTQSLSKFEFDLLQDFIGPDYKMYVRQSSVQVLSQVALTEEQYIEIAQKYLPETDAFLVPGLLNVLGQGKSDQVGQSVLQSLNKREDWQHLISVGEFTKVIANYSKRIQEDAAAMVDDLARLHDERLSRLMAMEKEFIAGDVGVGRSLFYGKALCSTCHAVGGQGSVFGPDLSNIGEIRSRHDLLEAIVYPSASFAREYETYHVQSGTTGYVGIIDEQTSSSLVIHTGPGSEILLSSPEIDGVETGTVSLMPSGLDKQLTSEELSHLITFLEALPYRLDRLIEINVGD